jgi:hypothetical protein
MRCPLFPHLGLKRKTDFNLHDLWICLCINWRYLYSFYITTCFGHCFWPSSGSIYIVTLNFSAILPSIGQCLHLGEGLMHCLQCMMPIIGLKHINIKMNMNLKTFIPIFEGYTLFTVVMPFTFHWQILNFFNIKYG